MVSAYDELPRTPANFVALSPLRYLERAAYIYPNQNAIIHGRREITWRDTYQRCRQFAHQLQQLGISKNDTVSVPKYSSHDRSALCRSYGRCCTQYFKYST